MNVYRIEIDRKTRQGALNLIKHKLSKLDPSLDVLDIGKVVSGRFSCHIETNLELPDPRVDDVMDDSFMIFER